MNTPQQRSTPSLDVLAKRALLREPGLPAIEYVRQWLSWGALQRVAAGVRGALVASGAGERQPVALIARNHPSVVAALLALIAERCTIQMVYAFQSPAAIAKQLEKLGSAVVVASREDLRGAGALLEALDSQGVAVIVLDDSEAAALDKFERVRTARALADRAEPTIEVLTSGTTGTPKQVPFPYALFEQHYAQSTRVIDHRDTPSLLFFPLGNITGLYLTLPPLLQGKRAVLLDRFNIADWHDWVVRFRPVNGGLPPAGIQMILDANYPSQDFSSMKFLGTGSAPLDPSVQREFERRYGIPILLSYGATEFGGPVCAMTLDLYGQWGKQKLGSVGRALPGAKLRVVDPDSSLELPPGSVGLLEVVSPRVGPEWIRTSDLAMIDADGFMFHRGRADGAIMRGGFKLVPEVIERALVLHPAVAAVAVVALEDRRLGQVPVAAVQLKSGAAWPGDEALAEHVRQHVPATHVPVTWVAVDELPRTLSMKVDRPGVRRLFARDAPPPAEDALS